MSETLVESLRFFASPRSVLPEHDMMLAAAARIAELEEALRDAKGLLDTSIARRRYAGNPVYDEAVASIRVVLHTEGK